MDMSNPMVLFDFMSSWAVIIMDVLVVQKKTPKNVQKKLKDGIVRGNNWNKEVSSIVSGNVTGNCSWQTILKLKKRKPLFQTL